MRLRIALTHMNHADAGQGAGPALMRHEIHGWHDWKHSQWVENHFSN
jgi:hypothetical protein